MNAHRLRRLGFSLGLLALSVSMLVVLSPASAARDATCTSGDAQAFFETVPVAAAMWRRGHEHPGILESLNSCQYRVFWDGETHTFHESDYIVGGIAYLYDYKVLGITRKEAIADMQLIGDRVWLAPRLADGTLGAFVEQTLTYTAYKGITDPVNGQLVYQHRGFITQLPAGEYVSYWVNTYPGFPDFTATVNLVILPG
jgi:hypothetical protein